MPFAKTFISSQRTTLLCRRAAVLWLLAVSLFQLDCHPSVAGPEPHWLWKTVSRTPGQRVVLQKQFHLNKAARDIRCFLASEYCHAALSVNDRIVARLRPFEDPATVHFSEPLASGEIRLQIDAEAIEGPAAIAARLKIEFIDGSGVEIVTDESWTVVHAGEQMPARSLGEILPKPWLIPQGATAINAFDDYTQWKQALNKNGGTPPGTFHTLPSYEIELVRSAGPQEGSWVGIAFDPDGRIVIAREDKGLLRLTPSEAGYQVATINQDLLECRGLLFANGSLYANANNSKTFCQLSDTDGDGSFDLVETLLKTTGGVGHGRNTIALGADGSIYSIHGDAVNIPTGIADRTSPFREHRRGQESREGHVLRLDPQEKTWEVVVAGLRNPFGIDFNSDGEMFTYDADAEFDMGSPWYRPTRVQHLLPGGDFGWRGVTGNWPPYFPDRPDNAPPTLDIGKGSPTAVKFGTKSHFSDIYRRALFVLDWAYGRIVAVHMVPRGASYYCKAETFLRGRPLNVTGLDFGPDGAMYFVTGGRKTQSALYRVTSVAAQRARAAAAAAPAAKSIQSRARGEFSAKARMLRRNLESMHRPIGDSAVTQAWQFLDSDDPAIRHAARIALEHQPLRLWKQRAIAEPHPGKSLVSLLALARSSDAPTPEILDRLNQHSLAVLAADYQSIAIRIYELVLANSKLPATVAAKLESLYPAGALTDKWRMQRLLVRENSSTIVRRILSEITTPASQADHLHGLFALRMATTGWTPELRRRQFEQLLATENYLTGQGMAGFLKRIRDDTRSGLSDSDRTLFDQWQAKAKAELGQTETAGPKRKRIREWKPEDLADSLSRELKGRNYARARQLFSDALCSRCHRLGGVGTPIGPDLTSVARRFSRRDLLESILLPSKAIAENYQAHKIVTTDGRILEGRVVHTGDYRSNQLKIATDPMNPGKLTELAKSEIEQFLPSKTSFMPQGLADTLTEDEILDLIALLESGGSSDSAHFRP